MVQKFYHNEQKKVELILGLTITALDKYNNRELDTDSSLCKALDSSIQLYTELNALDKLSSIQSLKATLTTAKRGVNPYTLEKVTIRRNEMISTAIFKVGQALEEMLRKEILVVATKLAQAEEMIGQIIIASIQSGLLKQVQIDDANDQAAISKIWKDISEDPGVNLWQKKVQLLVSIYDIYLLCDEVFFKIRNMKIK